MGTDGDQRDGSFMHCRDCNAPIVLFNETASGYKLVCACHGRSIALSTETQSSTLFEPISGKWSGIDDVDVPEYNSETTE